MAPDKDSQIPAALHRMCSIADAAHILGFSPVTVRQWAERGKVPVYRSPGGNIRLWLPDCIVSAGTHRPDRRRGEEHRSPAWRRRTASPGNPPPEPDEASSK